ncbi:hypothetical protein KI387_006419, partial [Taxus chinensis]
TFRDGHAMVKGLEVKVDDETLATVTSFPTKFELYLAKANPEEARAKFSDEDDNFIADRK